MTDSKKRNTKEQRKLATSLKIIGYSLTWLAIWGTTALLMVIVSLIIALQILDPHSLTARNINNLVLTIIIIIAAVFFLTVWLLRKHKSLFVRTSWIVLLVCTCMGLLVGVPMSLMGKWEPEGTPLSKPAEQEAVDSGLINTEPRGNTSPNTPSPTTNTQTPRATQNTTKEADPPLSQAGCKYYNDISYETAEQPDSSLKEGQTREVGGYNGSRKVCTDNSGTVISNDITSTPVNKTIYYGTFTYEQAQAKAKNMCNTSLPAGTPRNSTFYWDCVDRELKKIW